MTVKLHAMSMEAGFSSSGHRLGSGASAEVVAGRGPSGEDCAIKTLGRCTPSLRSLVADEAAALRLLHSHCMQLNSHCMQLKIVIACSLNGHCMQLR